MSEKAKISEFINPICLRDSGAKLSGQSKCFVSGGKGDFIYYSDFKCDKNYFKFPIFFLRMLLFLIQRNRRLNLFHATGLFLYVLKTPKNLWFCDVSRGRV